MEFQKIEGDSLRSEMGKQRKGNYRRKNCSDLEDSLLPNHGSGVNVNAIDFFQQIVDIEVKWIHIWLTAPTVMAYCQF